jgi:hypothetical protein
MNVYADFVEFIAPGVTPEQIVNYKPSQASQDRLDELLAKQRMFPLNRDETEELNRFEDIEHILRMAKARARQYVRNQ